MAKKIKLSKNMKYGIIGLIVLIVLIAIFLSTNF